MKNQKRIPQHKDRPSNGKYYPTIRRITTEQRHRIRQYNFEDMKMSQELIGSMYPQKIHI